MNQAFIDGQNLIYSFRNSKIGEIDLCKFRTYLKYKYKVDKAYYFVGYYDEQHDNLYKTIQEAGFIIVFRSHICGMKSIKKGNVDTDIVFEVMKKIAEKEDFDKAILVSGDGDYFKMVNYLIEKDKFLKLLAPCEHRMSSLYLNLSGGFCAFLDRKEVVKKIGK